MRFEKLVLYMMNVGIPALVANGLEMRISLVKNKTTIAKATLTFSLF